MTDNPPATATDPQAAREEIERTREALGDTVDALAHKLDVKTRVTTAVEERRQRVRQRLEPAIRRTTESPVPPSGLLVALVAALAIVLLWWRPHRRR